MGSPVLTDLSPPQQPIRDNSRSHSPAGKTHQCVNAIHTILPLTLSRRIRKANVPRLAVVIGIDKYDNYREDGQNEVPAIHGAVADADEVQKCLRDHDVPSDHIKNLRSPHTEDSIPATKVNIINVLSDLKTSETDRDEPILIYFAGHGGQMPAPNEWPTEGGMIQYLLPQDVGGNAQGEIINMIPDSVFADLLAEPAKEKGNNIVCSGTLFGQTEGLDADMWFDARLLSLTAVILIPAGGTTRSLALPR